ncbi:MAG: tRNA preQ1(34) S-adenosylmethionine ribosyltransferase-isomerase QueA [Armatimonadota bacterium]
MHISELDYDLPPELIAQQPARPRDSSRLLVLHRTTGQIEHRLFRDLPACLTGDDVVVLNDTRVIRARLLGHREPGGGKAEVLLLAERGDGLWEALVSPGRRMPPGRRLVFGDGRLEAEVVDRTPGGARLLRFEGAQDVRGAIALLGELPTPPYVHRPIEQESDYQTVYASVSGASAAPTAGLHFTEPLLQQVRGRVHDVVHVTLHIGLGTFRPIHTETVEEHDIHSEWFEVPGHTAEVVSQALADRRRVVAVGTSTARALEAATDARGRVRAEAAETKLFITPGYRFRATGALLTNFHLPRSTLLALVFALAGRDLILRAYREAVAMRYRFLSFGDAMLIV